MNQEARLWVPGKLVTLNAERKSSKWVRAANTKQFRTLAMILARNQRIPVFTSVEINVYPSQAKGVIADSGAHFPSAKAAVDGLVDAGILPDDGPEFVTALNMKAPTRGIDGMLLVIAPNLEGH